MTVGAEPCSHDWIASLYAAKADDLPLLDADHGLRCAAFAGDLFDATAQILSLASDDRPLAVAAALWHDVGYARDVRDHARKSFDLIAATRLAEFSDAERMIVACVARYHRRPLPNIEHAGFGAMLPDDQRRVRRLSGIVRIAVALDASHLGLIKRLDVNAENGAITLIAHATVDAEVERDRLMENAAAFRQLTYVPFAFDIVVDRCSVEE